MMAARERAARALRRRAGHPENIGGTMISHIIFTGDTFRTTAGEPSGIANAWWMDELLGPILRATLDKPSTVRLPLATASMTDIITLQGGCPDAAGWATMFWQKPTDALVEALATSCRHAIVVGFEMPPLMIAALDDAGIHWISISISPLRFLPDWALHIGASHHFDLSSITHTVVTADEIAEAAAHVSRWYAPSEIDRPTRVFFAQTSFDRSLIKGKRFCGVEDLAVVEIPDRVKPHPWEPESPIVQYLVERGAAVCDEETYALLANSNVEAVTFSSSVGREAQAFGRRMTILNPSVQDWTYSGVDVLRDWTTHRFWRPLLESAGFRAASVCGPAWSPNLLRRKHGGQGLDMAVWG